MAKELVKFLEKPGSDDEKHIHKIISSLLSAIKLREKEVLKKIISNNADIQSLLANGSFIGKQKYIELLMDSKQNNLGLENVSVRLIDRENAVCAGFLKAGIAGLITKQIYEIFYLKKTASNDWLIVKIEYPDLPIAK